MDCLEFEFYWASSCIVICYALFLTPIWNTLKGKATEWRFDLIDPLFVLWGSWAEVGQEEKWGWQQIRREKRLWTRPVAQECGQRLKEPTHRR